jgi:hypothetical protein
MLVGAVQALQGQEEEKTIVAVLGLVDLVITLVFRGFSALKPMPAARVDGGVAGMYLASHTPLFVCTCVDSTRSVTLSVTLSVGRYEVHGVLVDHGAVCSWFNSTRRGPAGSTV